MTDSINLADISISVYGELTEQEDIIRCIRNLALTPAGTVPLDRNFGIDNSFKGLPYETAKTFLAVELINKIYKYEPRASVKEIDMVGTTDGQIEAKVVIQDARPYADRL